MSRMTAMAAAGSALTVIAAGTSAAGDPGEPAAPTSSDASLDAESQDRLLGQIVALDSSLVPSEIAAFLAATPEDQAKLLEQQGFVVPSGPLTDPMVQQFLRGQWMLANGGDTYQALALIRTSEFLGASAQLRLVADAELADFAPTDEAVRMVTEAQGLVGEDAVRRATLQNLALSVRSAMRELDSGYLSLTITDDLSGLNYESSSAESDVASLLSMAGISDLAVMTTSDVSERELVDLLVEVAALPGIAERNTRAWVDKQASSVVVEAADVDRSAIEDAMSALATGRSALVEVRTTPTGPAGHEEVNFRGGVNATACTWGFTVAHDSLHRIVTAGHCGSSQGYGYLPFTFVPGEELNSGDVDAQVHDIYDYPTNNVDNAIQKGLSTQSITSVLDHADLDINDNLCHQGATTGWSCGQISSVNSAQIDGGGSNVLRVDGNGINSGLGDSGGPYVWNTSAIGLHEGVAVNLPPPNRIVSVTAVEFAQDELDFLVRIKPS